MTSTDKYDLMKIDTCGYKLKDRNNIKKVVAICDSMNSKKSVHTINGFRIKRTHNNIYVSFSYSNVIRRKATFETVGEIHQNIFDWSGVNLDIEKVNRFDVNVDIESYYTIDNLNKCFLQSNILPYKDVKGNTIYYNRTPKNNSVQTFMIYDKSRQKRLKGNVKRFELKHHYQSSLLDNVYGEDLKNVEFWNNVKHRFSDTFNSIEKVNYFPVNLDDMTFKNNLDHIFLNHLIIYNQNGLEALEAMKKHFTGSNASRQKKLIDKSIQRIKEHIELQKDNELFEQLIEEVNKEILA